MTSTLTDRYVAAATRTVPEKQRADLAEELRASIADQIDARVDTGESPDDAERTVLTALGDPDRLAADYTDRPLWLIGPQYYLTWWRLLKLLLWIVPPLAAVGVALGKTLSGAELGDIVGTTIVVVLQVIVHLAFWVTLVFVIIERSSETTARPLAEWSLDQLPEPRAHGASFGDMLASLILLIVAAAAILWDHFIGFAVLAAPTASAPLSVLDPHLWPWWIAGLFVIMALEGLLQVVVYLRGHWTVGFAVGNTVLALAAAVPAIWLLAEGRLLSIEFWTTVVPDEGMNVYGIIAVLTGFVIAGVAVWDIIDGFLKARRARATGS